MIRYVFGLLILTSVLSAQYTFNDIELVKTTYTQQYNKNIILPYLQSDDPQKVKAALLSIAQSYDTSFVPYIIKLNFKKFGELICFALGQIRESALSTEYLQNVLSDTTMPHRIELYEALGRTGTSETLDEILDEYKTGFSTRGFPFAIFEFSSRKITDSLHREFSILSEIFLNCNEHIQTRTRALFAASRLNLSQSALPALLQTLKEKPPRTDGSFAYINSEEDFIHYLQYALAAIRKTGALPEDITDLKRLLMHKDWRIRTEAIKTLALSTFNNRTDLAQYFAMLLNENPNVSRQTAISLRGIQLNDLNRKNIYELYGNYFDKKASLTANTAGELFISYVTHFPDELYQTHTEFEDHIEKTFIYNALEQNTEIPEKNVDYLLANVPRNNVEAISYFSAAAANLKPAEGKLDRIILDNLDSTFAPAVTIIAESLDSFFIEKYKPEIKEIIIKNIKRKLNDPDFSEALISLANLAKRTDTVFYNNVLQVLNNSPIYSLQKFSSTELKLPLPAKSLENFNDIWNTAFKYKSAKVITSKGEFIIKFNPQYSPVSTGNFCYLAEKGYFNNVKFHRVVPNFVIQTGDPQSTGWGGPGYEIISEFSPLDYRTGTVGMASAGKDTEGSQWFVTHSYFPHLNGRYTIFGHIIQGMDVVNTIDQGDEVVTIELNK